MSLREKLKVLVVDDMSTSRGLIVQALETIGIRNVDAVADGQTAIAALARSPAHLVVSDFNMPGMNGLQLLHALRTGPATARIGFLLITGRPDPQVIEHGRKLGMNNYIKKPFETNELKGALEAITGPL